MMRTTSSSLARKIGALAGLPPAAAAAAAAWLFGVAAAAPVRPAVSGSSRWGTKPPVASETATLDDLNRKIVAQRCYGDDTRKMTNGKKATEQGRRRWSTKNLFVSTVSYKSE
jgi:hypothetical protein